MRKFPLPIFLFTRFRSETYLQRTFSAESTVYKKARDANFKQTKTAPFQRLLSCTSCFCPKHKPSFFISVCRTLRSDETRLFLRTLELRFFSLQKTSSPLPNGKNSVFLPFPCANLDRYIHIDERLKSTAQMARLKRTSIQLCFLM